nr:hypothetical protein JVH1_0978 [Rhodococcus sp. JVH1]
MGRHPRVHWKLRIERVIGNGETIEKQRSGRECESIPGRTPVWGIFPLTDLVELVLYHAVGTSRTPVSASVL